MKIIEAFVEILVSAVLNFVVWDTFVKLHAEWWSYALLIAVDVGATYGIIKRLTR